MLVPHPLPGVQIHTFKNLMDMILVNHILGQRNGPSEFERLIPAYKGDLGVLLTSVNAVAEILHIGSLQSLLLFGWHNLLLFSENKHHHPLIIE